jgi:hypothetical protein
MRLLKSQLINLIKENLNESTRQDPTPPEETGSSLPIASYLVYPTLTKVSDKQRSYLEKAKGFFFDSKDYLIAAGFNLFWISTYFDENTFRPGTVAYAEYEQKSYRGLTEIYKTQHNEIFNNFDMESKTIKPTYSVEAANQRIKNMVNNLHVSLDKHFKLLSDPKVSKYIGAGKTTNYSNEKYQLLLPHDLDHYFNSTQANKIQSDLRPPMHSTFDKDFKHVYKRMYLGGESIEKKSWINHIGMPESLKPDELSKYFKVKEGNFPKVVMDQKIKELL